MRGQLLSISSLGKLRVGSGNPIGDVWLIYIMSEVNAGAEPTGK